MRYIYHYLSLFIYIPPKICERSHGGVIAPVEGVTDVSIGSPHANVRLLKYCSTTSNPKKQRLSNVFFLPRFLPYPFPTSRLWHMADVSRWPGWSLLVAFRGMRRRWGEKKCDRCVDSSGVGKWFPNDFFIYIYIYVIIYDLYYATRIYIYILIYRI